MINNWKETTIGQIADVLMGQSPPSDTYNSEGNGMPFFQGKAEFTELHPIVEKWCSKPVRVAKKYDILLSVRAPVGALNIADCDCCIGRGLAALRAHESQQYLYYYLLSKKYYLDSKGTGTTFRAISGDVIRNTPIKLPSIAEQECIVSKVEELFSELDKGVEYLQTAQKQLEVYRQAVLKSAFEGKFTNPDVKEGELPKGWSSMSLSEICEMKAGFFIKASEIHPDAVTGFYPCYGGNGIRGYVSSYNQDGEFPLIGRQGALCGNVHLASGKFYATEHAVVVKTRKGIDSSWLTYKLRHMRLNQYSTGVAQPGLSVNKLLPIAIAVPSWTEQGKIVMEIESRLDVCAQIEESLLSALSKSDALRQTILKQAFEGKLVSPTDSEDQIVSFRRSICSVKVKSNPVIKSTKKSTVK